MKKYLFLLAILIIFVAPVSASTFTIDVSNETIGLPAGLSETFLISINSTINDTITITLNGPKWMTLDNDRPIIGKNMVEEVKLHASPGINTRPGLYQVVLLFKSLVTGLDGKETVFVSVRKEEGLLINKITVTGVLEPTGHANFKVDLTNFGDVTIEDVYVTGVVRDSTKEIGTFTDFIEKVDPDYTASVEKTIEFVENAEAARYMVYVDIEYGDKKRSSSIGFNVARKFLPEVRKDFLVAFLGIGEAVHVTNLGNIPGDYTVSANLDFASGDIYDREEGGVYYWELNDIKPGETASVSYYSNYAVPILLLIVLIIIGWYFLFHNRAMIIKKNAIKQSKVQIGKPIAVKLEVKNKTGYEATNILVRDFIPTAFRVKQHIGMKASVKSNTIGAELVWKFENMGKNEERIVTYNIIPVLGLSGQVKLPRAKVQFTSKGQRNQVASTYSFIGLVEEKGKK